MAVATVNGLVDEGVAIPDGLVDEGMATEEIARAVSPQDRYDQAGKEWDLGMDLGIPLDEMRQHYDDFVLWDSPADPTSISDDALNYNFIPSIEFVERTQPQLRAMTKKELRDFRKRLPLPPKALPIEKFDRMLHIIGDPALRIFYKLGKGMLLNSPDAAWAVIKKVIPDDMQEIVKEMTLDEAVDWAMDYNPGAIADFMSETAEFIGGISTVGKLIPKMGPGILAKAGRGAVQFGGARGAKELAKLTAELVDPDTSYGYEGAKGVAEDMAIGAGFSVLASAAKPLKAAISNTAFGRALEEAAHKAAIVLTKKWPVEMDIVRKNPQAYFTKWALRGIKARIGKVPTNMTITEKAAIKHVARELERRTLIAQRNYIKNIPPDVVQAVKRRGLLLPEAPPKAPVAAPVAKPLAKVAKPGVELAKVQEGALKGTPTQTFLEPSEKIDVPRNDIASKESPLIDVLGNEFYKRDGSWIWQNPAIEEGAAFAGWTRASTDFNQKIEKWFQQAQPPIEAKPVPTEVAIKMLPAEWKLKVKPDWRKKAGWQAEVSDKDKTIYFESQADLENIDIVNHEIGHVLIEDKIGYITSIEESPFLKEYATIVGELDQHRNFVREHLAMDYGDYLTNPAETSSQLVELFNKYIPKPVPIEAKPEEKAIGFADPKTTRPGATTLINDAAVESIVIARDLTEVAIKSTKSSSNLLKRNVAKAMDYIATLGSGGKKISKDMDDIAFRAQRNSNIDLLAIKKAYAGMSHADRVKVSKLMNGYIKEADVSDKVAVAKDAILDVLDRGMHEANKVGIRRMVGTEKLALKGSGKAAPQVLNRKGIRFFKELDKKGMGSQAVLQMAERMIEEGQANGIEDAITKLQKFRDTQLRGINPYFERTRIELPEEFIEWDGLNTLPRLLEKNWLTIEGVRKWGWDTTAKSFPKANVAIEVIRKEFGAKESDRIQRFINASFLGKTTASLDSQQLTQAMRDYQFLTKIALSPVTILRNMADRLPKSQTVGGLLANIDAMIAYPPVLNNFIEGSRRIEKNIIKSGAAFGHTAMAEDFETGTQLKNIIGLPFSASELGNQIHIALVRKFQMERDINSLINAQGKTGLMYKAFDKLATVIGGSQKQVKNRLRELGNEELIERLAKGEELNGDLLDAVLHRTVRDKTFPILLSTKPIWWDNHPWARAAAQFKTWPVRQTQHIWNDVIKYTVKTGDISRMIRFLIATAMVGEVYNIARDFLTDRREALTNTLIDGKPQKDVVISLLNAFFDGGGIGILADFTYGFTDWLIGPSGSTVKNVRDTIARIYKEPDLTPQAILNTITKEIQPVKQARQIINQVDREHFNKGNITKQYAKWRAEGYKWAREKRAPTVGEKVKEFGDDFLYGKMRFRSGDDSLALEMAARQVMVGDLDDAADYIRLIIERASTPEKLAEAYKKIQISMRNRAPLGKVAEQDLGTFMQKLSDDDKRQVNEVTAVWFKNYADAITRAMKITEE